MNYLHKLLSISSNSFPILFSCSTEQREALKDQVVEKSAEEDSDTSQIQKLLQTGISPNPESKKPEDSLLFICAEQYILFDYKTALDIFKLLLKFHANPNLTDVNKKPLCVYFVDKALEMESTEVIDRLKKILIACAEHGLQGYPVSKELELFTTVDVLLHTLSQLYSATSHSESQLQAFKSTLSKEANLENAEVDSILKFYASYQTHLSNYSQGKSKPPELDTVSGLFVGVGLLADLHPTIWMYLDMPSHSEYAWHAANQS